MLHQYTYTLVDDNKLIISIYHNHAHICLGVWDDAEEEWYSVSRREYLWEQSNDLLWAAIALAEERATPAVADALQDLFSHPDFVE